MQYSIYTRGIGLGNNDYQWSPFPYETLLSEYADFGFSVERNRDGTFSVYILSEESQVQDYMNRRIRIGVLFADCSQTQAKQLAAWTLRHWGNYVGEFTEFVDRFGSDNWSPNDVAPIRFFDSVTKSVEETPGTAETISKRYHVGNTPENRRYLAELLQKIDFSDGEGLKLVAINGFLPGSSERIVRSQVDRYLAGDVEEAELDNTTPTSPPRSTTVKKKYRLPTFAFPGLLLFGLGYGVWFYNMNYLPLRSENTRLLREYAPFVDARIQFEEQKRIWDAAVAEQQQTNAKTEREIKAKNDEIRKADDRLHAIIQNIATLNTQIEKLNKEIDEKKKQLP